MAESERASQVSSYGDGRTWSQGTEGAWDGATTVAPEVQSQHDWDRGQKERPRKDTGTERDLFIRSWIAVGVVAIAVLSWSTTSGANNVASLAIPVMGTTAAAATQPKPLPCGLGVLIGTRFEYLLGEGSCNGKYVPPKHPAGGSIVSITPPAKPIAGIPLLVTIGGFADQVEHVAVLAGNRPCLSDPEADYERDPGNAEGGGAVRGAFRTFGTIYGTRGEVVYVCAYLTTYTDIVGLFGRVVARAFVSVRLLPNPRIPGGG